MKRFAFLSRHQPTHEQHELAARAGIKLVIFGDVDAFTVKPEDIDPDGFQFHGIVVVHPAAALRLCHYFEIGVYENASRAGEGERPTFFPVALHLYDLRS
jgi:hypothetical protein